MATSNITMVHVPPTGPVRLVTQEQMCLKQLNETFAIVLRQPIAEESILEFVEPSQQSQHWQLEVGISAPRLPEPLDVCSPCAKDIDIPTNERFEGIFGDVYLAYFVSNKVTRQTIKIPISECEIDVIMDQMNQVWMAKHRPVAAEYLRAVGVVYHELFGNHTPEVQAAVRAEIRDAEKNAYETTNMLMLIPGSYPPTFTPVSAADAAAVMPYIIGRLKRLAEEDAVKREAALIELFTSDTRPTRSQRKKSRMRRKARTPHPPVESAEPAEQVAGELVAAEPAEPVAAELVAAEPAEPFVSAEPVATEPLELVDPGEPVKPTELDQPTEQAEPAEPAEPALAEPTKPPAKAAVPVIDKPCVDRLTSDCCIVCEDGATDTVLLPCRHLCACNACALMFIHCPVCRAEISDLLRVFVC